MENDIIVYISAASDLQFEREVLGRIAAEIPVDLGWRIIQSPTGDGILDVENIQRADFHFLLLGGDIRAPIGQEWIIARQAGRLPILYLKQDILRTSAAIDFYHFIKTQAHWKPFNDGADLHRSALIEITNHILEFSTQYRLSLSDVENTLTLREQIQHNTAPLTIHPPGGTGSSSVILSPEAIASKGGVLLDRS